MKAKLIEVFALATLTIPALAAASTQDHSGFISGPFTDGPSVTRKCLECHQKEGASFMTSSHWSWSKKQTVGGKSFELGKKNAINNFCIALPSNWARCTSCHAGYGWKDGSFDFTKAENIDCLVCHDTTGTYKKFPAGAGHPVYAGEKKEFPKGKVWEPVDLVKVAQSVGPTSRATCGACHFYGGGGDHIKHGDLDSTLAKPTPDIDVHMGGKSNMSCDSCHQGGGHTIKGEAASVSVGSGERTMGCGDCHSGKVHGNPLLDKHALRVACQTCHIPSFAKAKPTKMWWDWSTAGKDLKPEEVKKDKYGEKLYDKMKGDFAWEKDVVPSYFWYNGTVDRLLIGDKVDPTRVVKLSSPKGSRNDANSKIFPFKMMRGKQPYDSGNNTMVVANVFGPPTSETAYWVKYDWGKAIRAGMSAAGQPFSGKYGWVETSMVWPVNHMVVPKGKALACDDCHGSTGRMNWKALGYAGDPRKRN